MPVPAAVEAGCGFLGLDPILVANEGTMVAFVDADAAERVLAVMQSHELGEGAAIIGEVTENDPGRVIARTRLGTRRVVDLPLGEQLPRIC